MARYLGPKEKIERRLGERLGLKGERSNSPKAAIVKRPYPPGQHGPSTRPRRGSEFGTQLKSKQKVRNMYRLMEKPFKAYVKRELERRGVSPFEGVVRALETRLDNTVFRMGLAQSRDQARQLVTHGHILLNGHKARTPSIAVRVGDVVAIREGSKSSPYFSILMPRWFATATPPGWLEVDKEQAVATVRSLPASQEEAGIQHGDLQAIIEFYSR
jgi:small subunit ribosomal protein S4